MKQSKDRRNTARNERKQQKSDEDDKIKKELIQQ